MKRLASIAASLLIACGPDPAARVCSATFSGNFADRSEGSCPLLEQADGGAGWLLRIRADAPTANTTVTGMIEFGPDPHPGTQTSQSSSGDWSMLATREPGCVYASGRGATPHGSYLLVLSGVELDAGTVRGTLQLEQSVHALPMASCGVADTETISFEF